MANFEEIQGQLRNLTVRQCQILYWVCQGKDYAAISELLKWSPATIQQEMSLIYDALDVTHLSRNERRHYLFQTVCPIQLAKVSNPDADCSTQVIDVTEVQPNPQTLALVKADERAGVIPLNGELIVPPQRNQMMDPYRGAPSVQPPKRSMLPWLVMGILGILMVVMLGAIVILIAILIGGRTAQPVTAVATSAPVVVTVLVTAPPSTAQAAAPGQVITVVVTQPPPPPPTAVALVATATATPIAATATATLNPTGVNNLAGKVPDDIPGFKLPLGITVGSVVDSNTKPFEVYSVDLAAGQNARFTMTNASSTALQVYLHNPGTKSITTNTFSRIWDALVRSKFQYDYLPAATDTYFFAVRGTDAGQRYTLVITQSP